MKTSQTFKSYNYNVITQICKKKANNSYDRTNFYLQHIYSFKKYR